MDIFQKIAKEQPLDFRVFQNKKTSAFRSETPIGKKEEGDEKKLDAIQVIVEQQTEEVQKELSGVEKQKEKMDVSKETKQQSGPHPEKQVEAVVISFPTPKNGNEEAVLKLEVQLETQKSYMLPVFPIVRYLKNKCLADTDFASKVNDEKKTLEKCFQFVISEIKKALAGKNGWLDDNEVYALAETYFWTIVNKKDTIFKYIFWERLDSLPIPEGCFHFIWCQIS